MKTTRLITLLCLAGLTIAVQAQTQTQPQLAYRILSGYVEKKQMEDGSGMKTGGTILAVGGGLLIGGAAATWFAGDSIAAASGYGSMPGDLKTGLTLGLGLSGLATSIIGGSLLLGKPTDYKLQYGEVFNEKDQQIQEALAIAALRDISVKGKKRRMTGALTNLLVPLVNAAIIAGINVGAGRDWYQNIHNSVYWSAFSLVGGVSSLLSVSEEERLYDKYLVGREAMYGSVSK